MDERGNSFGKKGAQLRSEGKVLALSCIDRLTREMSQKDNFLLHEMAIEMILTYQENEMG